MRQDFEWRLGLAASLGSLFAIALAERMYDIRADLIRTQCNCEPFQWSDPRITTPLLFGIPLGILLLAFTAYSSVQAINGMRHAGAPAAQSGATPVGAGVFFLALIADASAWIITNSGASLIDVWGLVADPYSAGDGIGFLPLYYAIFGISCGAILLLIPLGALAAVLRRASRATPAR
jgi:hypothetical protein